MLPSLDVRIELSDIRNSQSRSPYTVFILLGDFGGFQGAIILIPSFLMSLYSSRMFERSLASDVPLNLTKNRSKVHLKAGKVVASAKSSHGLLSRDISDIRQSIKGVTRLKLSIIATLFKCKWFCKQNQEQKFKKKVGELYEAKLDIRSFFNLRTNLSLLVRLLLSEK